LRLLQGYKDRSSQVKNSLSLGTLQDLIVPLIILLIKYIQNFDELLLNHQTFHRYSISKPFIIFAVLLINSLSLNLFPLTKNQKQ